MVLGKVFNSLWHNLYEIGRIFIAENGQILKTQIGDLVTLITAVNVPIGKKQNKLECFEHKKVLLSNCNFVVLFTSYAVPSRAY